MNVIKEVKNDLKNSTENVSHLVSITKDIVFDDRVQKTIKVLIVIVKEKNMLAKEKDEAYHVGDDKKVAVISILSEWINNLTCSNEKAVEFVEIIQSKIEAIIDDYIFFSN